jgi:hypothetical protein
MIRNIEKKELTHRREIFSSKLIGSSLHRSLLWVLLVALSGCASGPGRLGSDAPDLGHADAAAYGADGFTFGKQGQVERPANNFRFYFKNCALSDNQTFYSKTSYWCESY